jgi:hypothetical protein
MKEAKLVCANFNERSYDLTNGEIENGEKKTAVLTNNHHPDDPDPGCLFGDTRS